jgi:hypothetical protein
MRTKFYQIATGLAIGTENGPRALPRAVLTVRSVSCYHIPPLEVCDKVLC